MNFERLKEKLEILADAAKYDVSCSSSGGTRKIKKVLWETVPQAGSVTYLYGRRTMCFFLKILLTNHCIYDCAYCVSRSSNDIKELLYSRRSC
jgi:predicted DNA-binding helix-hairpin-helix protein